MEGSWLKIRTLPFCFQKNKHARAEDVGQTNGTAYRNKGRPYLDGIQGNVQGSGVKFKTSQIPKRERKISFLERGIHQIFVILMSRKNIMSMKGVARTTSNLEFLISGCQTNPDDHGFSVLRLT